MKKSIIIYSLIITGCGVVMAQDPFTAFNISQSDLKGTARYMGMAGAFGALGGDLTAISQNPGGIGVYRSSDIGFTLDLDAQSSSSQNEGMKYDMSQTKFYLNNIGAVFTLKLPSNICPNLNFGFTYNKGASFNRIYGGNIGTLRNSMSNYIAGIAQSLDLTQGDVSYDNDNDPYNPAPGYIPAPWLTVLGYDSFLINPEYIESTKRTNWYGLWDSNGSMTGQNTAGSGSFLIQESGGLNEFNIVIGGNVNDILYWGMNFDIINLNYNLSTIWGENLTNAIVPGEKSFVRGNADWNLNSLYTLSGTGFNYQLGFIVKPIQPIRLGFAFHTPTWYSLNEEFSALTNYNIGVESGSWITNDGIPGYNSYNFRTPWRIIASAAGVIGSKLIVSFDYEWANYGSMKFSETKYYDGYYDYDWDYPWDYPWWYNTTEAYTQFPNINDPYNVENSAISSYYKSSNTFRVGIEFKPISALSIRAGYSNVSSPVRKEIRDNQLIAITNGLTPSYRLDNSTNYITCGLGFRYSHFYADLAYVYKHMESEYHAYSSDPENPKMPSPQSKISLNNNQVVLSLGYRF